MTRHSRYAFALIADLDGTLIDSIPFLFQCYRYALGPFLDPLPTDAELYPRFGKPNAQTLAQYASGAALDGAIARYRDFYTAHLDEITLFPGIDRLIDAVRGRGWAMAVVTGKSRSGTDQTLGRLGISGRIDSVVCGDEVAAPKPAPDGIRLTLRTLDLPPDRAIYVGDSPDDIAAGRRASISTGAAFWAAFSPERLSAAGADYRFERIEELIRWVETHRARSPVVR